MRAPVTAHHSEWEGATPASVQVASTADPPVHSWGRRLNDRVIDDYEAAQYSEKAKTRRCLAILIRERTGMGTEGFEPPID